MTDRPFFFCEGPDAAEACYRNLCILVDALREAQVRNDDNAKDEAFAAIHATPSLIQVRTQWQTVGVALEPALYCLTLHSGEAGVRLFGLLDRHYEAVTAHLQYQSLLEFWVDWPNASEAILLTYARAFAFV